MFGSNGTLRNLVPSWACSSAEDLEFIHQNRRTWLDVLRHAISVVHTLSGIDELAKIGIIGESLGAYLSLHLELRTQELA